MGRFKNLTVEAARTGDRYVVQKFAPGIVDMGTQAAYGVYDTQSDLFIRYEGRLLSFWDESNADEFAADINHPKAGSHAAARHR